MRRLTLLRHAKAVSKQGARDFDRALASRGRDEAAAMAEVLRAHVPALDRALVSPARRTRETWLLVGSAFPGVPTTFDERIYDAETALLLRLAQDLDDAAASVAMVGHNPGFEDLALTLAEPSSDPTRGRMEAGMPTCAAAILDFDVARWRDVRPEDGRLVAFLTPPG